MTVLMPQPGDYAATGLPLQEDLFRAWLFLQANMHAQPAAYRNSFSLDLTKRLYNAGERDIKLLSAGLLAVTAPGLRAQITRRLGADISAHISALAPHIITRFAYIGMAEPSVQKLALALLTGSAAQMQKIGEDALFALNDQRSQGGDVDVNMPTLVNARDFLLVADKIDGNTGNRQLESEYLDAVLSYASFRRDYLVQLAGIEGLPAHTQAAIATQLQDTPRYPAFEETALLDHPDVRAAYQHIILDPRVKPDLAGGALDIAETLSSSGDAAPATIAAALLQTALPHITAADQPFLALIAGDDCVNIITDNASAINAQVPIAQAPVALRQMSVAQAISAMKFGEVNASRLNDYLSSYANEIDPRTRRAYIHDATMMVKGALREISSSLLPQIDQMESPAMAAVLKRQINATIEELDRLNALEGGTRKDTPRRDGPAGGGQSPSF